MLAEQLPKPDMWDIRIGIAQDSARRLQRCLALSGKRGGAPGDIPGMIARLITWLRSDSRDVGEWNRLMSDAGFTWDEWYDWYSRIYTRPNAVMCGLSLDEWGKVMYE